MPKIIPPLGELKLQYAYEPHYVSAFVPRYSNVYVDVNFNSKFRYAEYRVTFEAVCGIGYEPGGKVVFVNWLTDSEGYIIGMRVNLINLLEDAGLVEGRTAVFGILA